MYSSNYSSQSSKVAEALPPMLSATGRDKRLPVIPVDMESAVPNKGPCTMPSLRVTTYTDTNKALPRINAEKVLSEEDIARLHELWNGAGLSARRRRRDQRDPTLLAIPPPIFIPEPGNSIPTLSVPSADLSIPNMATTPISGTRKRWGFLSARPTFETQDAEKKTPNALEKLRAMAQDRLKKLRYAKSAPDLGDQAIACRQGVAFQPPTPLPAGAARDEIGPCSRSRNLTPPGKSPIPEVVLQQEDADENAIYFTMGLDWRTSWGSADLVPITAIPDSADSLDRIDSPLLHRHFSLDQLSFAARIHAANTLPANEYPSSAGPHPIDELHAYLEL